MVYDKYLEQLFQKSRGKNYFYIHRDKQKALIAAQPFINTYNQNRNDIYNRMRDRYQKNFLNSINSATNAYGIDLLSDASELTDSEIVKFISDSLKDFLNQSANNATNKEYIESVLNETTINKFNKQYGKINIIYNSSFHDRFLIIDNIKLYHIGASLKDIGKKCFAISELNSDILEILSLKIRKIMYK